MNKNKYYVSVQSGSILPNQGDAAYELEITANDAEVDQLQSLFAFKELYDEESHLRAIIPGIPYNQDEENDRYDQNLNQIYQLLHTLGTPETKQHIDTMNLM
ncbi:hypothetical protein NV379_24195 [Paenibacillus sp. N1-5-1-14]|uniref:hypothetical protein n=1 Tax=Paenibacillus radicibacter TaxID=2972488 RepID=UPI0021590C19|nr:hypothetical protein [Paenibacillus radicibacter]MCR8645746.1 hypothetical protein [Paenibacillus radicibacter]